MTKTHLRPGWDETTDDDFHHWSLSKEGHLDPTIPEMVRLGRAVSYAVGGGHKDIRYELERCRFQYGYNGTHPSKYDYVPCDEDGTTTEYDDDDNEVVCEEVFPVTWAVFPIDD